MRDFFLALWIICCIDRRSGKVVHNSIYFLERLDMVQFFFNWFLSTLRRVSAWRTFLISLDFFCLVFYTTKTFRDILTLLHATHYHNGGGVNRNTIWVKIPLFLRGKSIFEVFVKRKTIFDIRSSRMPLTFGIHKTCLRFVEVHEIVNNSVHMCDDYFSKHAKNLYVSKLMTHTVIFGVHFFGV